MRRGLALWLVLAAPGAAQTGADYRADACGIEAVINEHYAYLDRYPSGVMPMPARLREACGAVGDRDALLRHAEAVLHNLVDHHAITGSALADSWAVVPSFADLWIVTAGDALVIDAVREGSPAAAVGVVRGDRLVSVDGVPVAAAVTAFWQVLGVDQTNDEQMAHAARILAAGRRDRPRRLAVQRADGGIATLNLPSLYAERRDLPPVSVLRNRRQVRIRFNDRLGDTATIAAFDAAMAVVQRHDRLTIDLTDTPGGGNTVVARAIMGWFVDQATAYQIHDSPREFRQTGIARRWIEQVLPRHGKRHRGPVTVQVGRFTGSMGEGLAVGFAAIGARVEGSTMAGLRGAIEDVRLPRTGLVIKLPTERLFTVSGQPREDFVPGKHRRKGSLSRQ